MHDREVPAGILEGKQKSGEKRDRRLTRVKYDDRVCCGQVDAQAAGPRGKQERKVGRACTGTAGARRLSALGATAGAESS